MGRGIISGTFWGILVSVIGLGTASLLAPQPVETTRDAPEAQAPEAVLADPDSDTRADGAGDDGAIAETADEAGPAADAADEPQTADASGQPELTGLTVARSTPSPSAPQVIAPRADGALPDADTDPAGRPLTEGLELAFGAPAAGTSPGFAGAAAEQPVLPNPQARAPQLPGREDDLTFSTDPAPVPAAEQSQAGAETPVESAVEAGAESRTRFADPADDVLPAMPPEPGMPGDAEVADAPQPRVDTDAPMMQAPSMDEEIGAGFGAIAQAMPEGRADVRINRPGDADVAASDPVDPAEPEVIPALVRYGAAFENPGDLALISVILIDDAHGAGLAAAVEGLAFPVTVAIDPSRPDAAQVMQTYRAAGIEVMALARLPEGALPSDVEVTLGYAFDVLPQSIGVLDAGGGVQTDQAVATQAAAILAVDGRGLVATTQGLNTGARAAAAAGVRAHVIHRDLDADGEDTDAITRLLDRAAFEARRDGGVIMLGRVRPDTIAALTRWSVQIQTGVALAPVSAVLRDR